MKHIALLSFALTLCAGCIFPDTDTRPDITTTNETTNVNATTEIEGGDCPVDGPFEVGVDSANKYCVCPAGYDKTSNVIGYESCYNGAECPILEVECFKTVDTSLEVGPSEDDLASLGERGELYNEDYGYIIEVGTEQAAEMTEVAIAPFDGVTATYVYCYNTVDTNFASSDCPGTAAEVFRINIYTSDEYDAIAEFSIGTVITETVGHVYELSHPNGLFPVDVPANDNWYDSIVTSFHFAG